MIEQTIDRAIESAKTNGWEILSHTSPSWFRWRNGRVPAGCTVPGALLLLFCQEPGGNFPIPNPDGWYFVLAKGLGVEVSWVVNFLKYYESEKEYTVSSYPSNEFEPMKLGLKYRSI